MTSTALPVRRYRTRYRKNRQIAITRDGAQCLLCGSVESLSMHHVRPRLIGGSDEPHNLVTTCRACHDDIHDRAERIAAWITWLYGLLVFSRSRGPPTGICERGDWYPPVPAVALTIYNGRHKKMSHRPRQSVTGNTKPRQWL